MNTSAYKLTRKDRTTHNGFLWPDPATEPDKWVETSGEGALCGPGWLHFYTSPLLAVLMNPIHAAFPADNIMLWRAEVGGKRKNDRGLKFGATRGRLCEQMPLPVISHEESVCIAIMWAMQVVKQGAVPVWDTWATDYLNGQNRGNNAAAYVAANAAAYAANAAANAAAYAAYTAYTAAYAAYTANAANAANAAAYAAYTANAAADINLHDIAERAIATERARGNK